MKKQFILVLLFAVLSFSACHQVSRPASGDYKLTPWIAVTSADQPIYSTPSEHQHWRYLQPILLTSLGQSADILVAQAAMERLQIPYASLPVASAQDLMEYKTIFIIVGASKTGMNRAGTSEQEELQRAQALADTITAAKDKTVILCHIGGVNRRSDTSDRLAMLIAPCCNDILLREEGNQDGFFTTMGEDLHIPVTLMYTNQQLLTFLQQHFAYVYPHGSSQLKTTAHHTE